MTQSSLGLAAALAAGRGDAAPLADPPPGTPSAFATSPSAGPPVSSATFEAAEKLMRVDLTDAERQQAASTWSVAMAPLYDRRTGPKRVPLEATLAPASRWDPRLPGAAAVPQKSRFIRAANPAPALPARDADIAFAPVWQLSRWIEARQLTAERSTRIYLERLRAHDGRLRCVITLTPELALAQARRADAEIAQGRYRGPLHGIPWGAKDLLDTAGIATTYGAEPFRDRVPQPVEPD